MLSYELYRFGGVWAKVILMTTKSIEIRNKLSFEGLFNKTNDCIVLELGIKNYESMPFW
jgi:hypothetical protein